MRKLRYFNVLSLVVLMTSGGVSMASAQQNQRGKEVYTNRTLPGFEKENEGVETSDPAPEAEPESIQPKEENPVAPQSRNSIEKIIDENFDNKTITQTTSQPENNGTKFLTTQEKRQLNDLSKIIDQVQYLLNMDGIDTEFDENDGSLNFQDGKGTLNWITFSTPEKDGVTLYTLHIQSLRPKGGEDVKENMIYAADYITKKSPYQAYYVEDSKGGKIEFTFPVYASSPEEFYSVLKNMQKDLETRNQLYAEGYAEGKKYNDLLQQEWQNNIGAKRRIPTSSLQRDNSIKIENIDFKAVSLQGKSYITTQDYNPSVDKSKLQFLVPRLTFTPTSQDPKDVPTGCQVAMKLIGPDGKTIVYDESADYTQMEYVPIKGVKEQTFEFTPIGTDKSNVWESGMYKIELFENGKPLYKYQFVVQDN